MSSAPSAACLTCTCSTPSAASVSQYRNGAWFKDFIYGPAGSGRLLAMESTAQATSYVTVDPLGSTRLVTTVGRNVISRHDYLPFGKELPAGVGGRTGALGYGADDRVLQRFTGQEVDTETGLDHFFFRYYSGRQGRFTTPDPLLAGDPADPQTWNRYAYVLGNPLLYTDPFGLQPPGQMICEQRLIPISVNLPDRRPIDWVLKEVCYFVGPQRPDPPTGPGTRPGGTGPNTPSANEPNFFSSARLPGESLGACVDRLQKTFLGETGQKVLNALTPASLLTTLFTFSPGTTLASAGHISPKVIATRIVDKPTVAGALAKAAIQEGSVSAQTAAAVQTGSAVVGKVVAPIAAIATGLELGFIAACR